MGAPFGNQNQRGRQKAWNDALRKELWRKYNDSGEPDHKGKRALTYCARALVRAAMNGEIQALREIGDRIDGKVSANELDGGIRIVLALPEAAVGGQALEAVEVLPDEPKPLELIEDKKP